MVFEWFAELLMNTTRETVEPAMHAAAEDISGDFPDIVPNETRNLMGFFISVRRLLTEVRHSLSTDFAYRARYLMEFSLHTVWCQRLHLYRHDKTDPRPTCEDPLLPHQLCPFPRIADPGD